MSVCQYYLRGNCRFGNRCRQLHENIQSTPPPYQPRRQFQPNNIYRTASPPGRPNHSTGNSYGSQQRRRNDTPITKWIHDNFENRDKAIDILIELRAEATIWQKSSDFWRFTSRVLFPGGHPLENWVDQSFEEVKWAHRCMVQSNEEHIYKKSYYDYWEKTERQLLGMIKLHLDTLKSLKPYIDEYINSNHQPSKTLSIDDQMRDVNEMMPSNFSFQVSTTNHTQDENLLEQERVAFESDTFEFGQIPMIAPPTQYR